MIADAAHPSALRAADWLCLAAAPTFALMAVLTAMFGGDMPTICSMGLNGFPLGGMALMYALMSAFHSAPWLKLLARKAYR